MIGFISPASTLTGSNLTQYRINVAADMAQLGMPYKFSDHSFGQYQYLSGTDQERAADLMAMYKDPQVKYIIANRGGWGFNRFLDLIDYNVIKANPKPIQGYSDLTGLLNAITSQTGHITFHGPMGVDNWLNGKNADWIKRVVMQGQALPFSSPPEVSQATTINPGKARGKLIGGNLSVFSALLGSKYLPKSYAGYILFLEEVEELPRKVDRMMTSIYTAGILDQISGFVFGQCTTCTDNPPTFTWQEIIDQKIKPLGIPAFRGAWFGHDLTSQFVLPIGGQVEIDADKGTITMLESAVA
jgi:muramoyltetrapeptide carboxypeptidase